MTVYVDNMKMKAQFFRWNGIWSNMYADTTEELEAMADRLGLSVMSMIDQGYVTERYVITEKKRIKAIEFGAKAVTMYDDEVFQLLENRRQEADDQGYAVWKEKLL